ncbi:MAG: PilZ domain-containing protein, partial [Bdellovibrionales bacterium]|nr:PilZ domain-containing protein [Bdellovibrionales bacterium]
THSTPPETKTELPTQKTSPPQPLVPSPPPLPAGINAKPVDDRRFNERDRRSQPRFSTEFRVVLITGAHSFRNTTEDVSMGGMRLKRPVPHAFISQKCTIFVSHPDLRENVQVSCKVLADPKDPRRIQFTETDPVQLKRLEEWLAESTLRKTGVA